MRFISLSALVAALAALAQAQVQECAPASYRCINCNTPSTDGSWKCNNVQVCDTKGKWVTTHYCQDYGSDIWCVQNGNSFTCD